jgi:cyclomaltodextrinase
MDGNAVIIAAHPALSGDSVPVPFSFRPPGKAERVSLAGTFNEWNTHACIMQNERQAGLYETVLFLEPGVYQYKFVVDNQHWYLDPYATNSVDNNFGGRNSVIVVSAEYQAAAVAEKSIFGCHQQTADRSATAIGASAVASAGASAGASVRASAMSGNGQASVLMWHDPAQKHFYNAIAPGRYALRLRTFRGLKGAAVEVVSSVTGTAAAKRCAGAGAGSEKSAEKGAGYSGGTVVMQPLATVGAFEYYEVNLTIPEGKAGTGYVFRIDFAGSSLWLDQEGVKSDGDQLVPWELLPSESGRGQALAPAQGSRPEKAPVRYFETPDWVQHAVFYQIFPERFADGDPANNPPGTVDWYAAPRGDNFFGGDLQGIRNKIPYLKELGVNAVYLNPVFCSHSNHKYNIYDYFRIDPAFGDNELFARLIEDLHSAGIRVIMDMVYNHTAVDFEPFRDVMKNGAASRYKDWYFFHGFPVRLEPPNYECWWGLWHMPKLNTGNPEVENYLFEVTRYWLKMGADGFRLDVPCEIPHEFWVKFRRLVKSIKPDAYIVGEIWDDGSPWLAGDQFDAVMNYCLRDEIVAFIARHQKDVRQFDSALARLRLAYPHQANRAMFNVLGSHDTKRILTISEGNIEAAKLAVLLQMTYPGAPCIYYGDEVGMEGGKDPECRGGFPWDPARQNKEMSAWYHRLIALRNNYACLRTGGFRTLANDPANGIYAYLRTHGSAEMAGASVAGAEVASAVEMPAATDALVVMNCGSTAREVHIQLGMRHAGEPQCWKQQSGKPRQLANQPLDALSGKYCEIEDDNGALRINLGTMAPGTGALLLLPVLPVARKYHSK